jgi:hypothetical protein
MANVFESGPFAARATSGDASHARTPGMVNPLKMGLLGGLQGYLQGVAQDQTMTRKYQQQASIEEMKARNNRLIKMLETDAQQRAYTVHQVGDDGKVYDVSMRNTYNPQSGKYEPTEISRAPTKDPMAATNALIASREKIAGNQIAAANQRNKDRLAARNDPSVETAAERRNREAQKGLNQRAALRDANNDMRDYNKAEPSDKAKMLKDAGITIDPKADPAGAKKAYHDAVLAQHQADYETGGSKPAPEPGESTAHPDKTPKGQPIKYDGEGNAYIKGPDGKPVPYDPTADASSTGSGLALDSDEAQALAQDHAPADPEAQQEDDGQGQGLLAAADEEPQGEAQDDSEPDDDTETESEYQRGMSPAGYPPQGPLTSEDDEGGILA